MRERKRNKQRGRERERRRGVLSARRWAAALRAVQAVPAAVPAAKRRLVRLGSNLAQPRGGARAKSVNQRAELRISSLQEL
eukprot:2401679-Pleurochrysis_carterae.AAC.1